MGNITSYLCSCFGGIVGGLYENVETQSNTSEQISEMFQLLENGEVLDSGDEAFPYNPFDDYPMNPFGDDDEDEEEFPPYPIGVDLNYPINLFGDDDEDEEVLPPYLEDDYPINPFGADDEEELIFPLVIEIVIEEEQPLLHRG